MGQNNVDWLTVSPLSGNSGSTTISITASTYSDFTGRSATIIASNSAHSLSSSTIINQINNPYYEEYLTLDIISAGTLQFGCGEEVVVASGRVYSYSINNGDWTSVTSATEHIPSYSSDFGIPNSVSVSSGDKVRIKALSSTGKEGILRGTASFNVYGNILSLQYGDDFTSHINSEESIKFFGDTTVSGFRTYPWGRCSKVVNAENLVLPSLGPKIPEGHYGYPGYEPVDFSLMFQNCTALTVAPKILPATNVDMGSFVTTSYQRMFAGCTAMTTAPLLPAPFIDRYANSHGRGSYSGMFEGCTSLTGITCLAIGYYSDEQSRYIVGNISGGTGGWLSGARSVGVFTKSKNVNWPTGDSGIPSGWTVTNYT